MLGLWLWGGDPMYQFALPLAAFVFALIAQGRVTRAFRRYSQVASRSGLTGAEVAELLLRSRGIADVRVEATHGFLRDHYDPTTKTLRLSEPVFHSRSVAALGIAAHETGHALQHADAYAWLTFRSAIVPVVSVASRLGVWLFPVGCILLYMANSPIAIPVLYAAAIALAAVVVFSLITLPVEIDASRRALRLLGTSGILVGDEVVGAKRVLDAAAWTYVAAAAAAIMELLRVLSMLGLLGRRDRD